MGKVKVVTSSVEVFRVKGETIDIAFNNFKQERSLDNHHLTLADSLDKDEIINGGIFKRGRKLYTQFLNNKISEYSVYGCLYNHKPIIKDESRLVKHNIVNKGTKKWITVNKYIFDSGEVLEHDTGTKGEAMVRADELSLEHNRTITVMAGKELENGEGILYISEYIPLEQVDDTNIYVFWIYVTTVKELEEDELIDSNTKTDEVGQLSIKDELNDFVGRSIIVGSD